MFIRSSRLFQAALGCAAIAAMGCSTDDAAQSAPQQLSTAQCQAFDVNGTTTICHATGSARNPIQVLRVATSACINGHSGHAGDRIAVDGNCGPDACLPVGAPVDNTLACCSLGNVTRVGSTCACAAGFANCDNDALNGCEVDLNTVAHCGSCGVACAVPHGTPSCTAGSCGVASCDEAYTLSGGACVPDGDHDAVPDSSDNCPTVANADQRDTNNDLQGDACECLGVSCAALDQCHGAGTCDPTNGACSNPSLADGTGCSDGNACTRSDTCQAGACTGSNPVTCVARDQCHVAGSCNPMSGACDDPNAPDGTACDDGSLCTAGDACSTGACGGAPVETDDHNPCTADACSPSGGVSHTPTPGMACGDGDLCNGSEVCNAAGACVAGTPTATDDHNPCTADSCNPATGEAVHTNDDGAICSDGNACTRVDACRAGACVGSDPVVCAALDQCHTAGTCDPSNGVCSTPNAANGTSCSDGSGCTQSDTCQNGTCTSGAAVTCQNGTCNSAGGSYTCGCSAGFADCDGSVANGCEVATTADAANCGGCGVVCGGAPNASGACRASACVLACAGGYGDCDGNAANGCETSVTSSDANCGTCGHACGSGYFCQAGICENAACAPPPSAIGTCSGVAFTETWAGGTSSWSTLNPPYTAPLVTATDTSACIGAYLHETTRASGGHAFSSPIATTPGQTYCLGGWIRGAANTQPFLGIRQSFPGNVLGAERWLIGSPCYFDGFSLVSPVTPDGSWHWYARSFTMPTGWTATRVEIEAFLPGAPAPVDFGTIQLFAGPCPLASGTACSAASCN